MNQTKFAQVKEKLVKSAEIFVWFNQIVFKKPSLVAWNKFFFLLAGHKVDFIGPCGANKSTFWPASRKKIVCNTGKTLILLVWLLPSLCSGIKLDTRKINFFFPSCTMFYCSINLRFGQPYNIQIPRWIRLNFDWIDQLFFWMKMLSIRL